MSVLRIVQKFFPKVETVRDLTKPIVIEVTKRDATTSERRSHKECALAIACKRQEKVDGVVISRSIGYLIKGKTAIRFGLPPSVAREITSFDRGAGFEPGIYSLSRAPHKLGEKGGRGKKKGTSPIRYVHVTDNIRAILGGAD